MVYVQFEAKIKLIGCKKISFKITLKNVYEFSNAFALLNCIFLDFFDFYEENKFLSC